MHSCGKQSFEYDRKWARILENALIGLRAYDG